MNLTISKEIQEHVQQRMGESSEIILMVACRIWFYSNDTWVYSELEGGLSLAKDHNIGEDETGNDVFYLFDLNTFDVTFRLYLYRNFYSFYKRLNTHFYYFRMPNTSCMTGFSFCNAQEATLLNDELKFLSVNENEKMLHNPSRIQEQIMINNFENDRPLEQIDLNREKERLQNAKLNKSEMDILRNAGISKGNFLKDASTRSMIVDHFIDVLKEKKVQHETKLLPNSNFKVPSTNPESAFENLRKSSVLMSEKPGQPPTNMNPSNYMRQSILNRSQVLNLSSIPIPIPQAPPLLKLLQNDHTNKNGNYSSELQHIQIQPQIMPPQIKQSLLEEIHSMKVQLKPLPKTNPLLLTKQEGMSLTYKINANMRERRRQLQKNVIEDDEINSAPWDSLDEEDDD